MIQTHRYTALLLAVLLVGAAAGPSVVTAQEEDEGFWDTVPADEEAGVLEQASAAVDGLQARLWGYVKSNAPVGDAPPTADENAEEAIATINEYNDSETVAYVNDHVADGVDLSAYDVVKVRVTGHEGETATFYVNGTVENGSLTAFEAVETAPENRTIDYTVEFETETASEQLSEDLEWLHESYVAEDRAPDKAARNRFGTAYTGALNVTAGDE